MSDRRRKREEWEKSAAKDLESRWEDEAPLAMRRVHDLSFSERWKFEQALEEEKERAAKLLLRRLKDLATGTVTESLVDQLIEEGLERAEDVLEDPE